MTIGPLPMTRIESMSVRLGIRAPAPLQGALSLSKGHQTYEPVEQVAGVVGARGCFWVVLHREGLQLAVRTDELQTLDHVIVEADVADFSDAEGRLVAFRWGGGDCKPVVVRSDLNLARGQVHHWLIDAAVTVT